MKTLKNTLILCMLLGVTGLAYGQVKMNDPSIPGGSMATAVRLVAPSDVMVDRQIRRWVRQHYPGWDADPYEIQDLGLERYATVRISAANQPVRKVWFRLITNQADPEAREGGSFPF